MISLFTCLGITLFAMEPTIFRDEDTGFVMKVPAGMQRTWNVSNSDNGIEIVVFQSDSNEEKFSIITTGKFPLKTVIGEGSEGLYPFVVEQLQSTILANQKEEGFPIQMEILPSLANDEYCGQRFRIHLFDEDWDEPFHVDIHAFMIETYSCIVMTGVFPETSEDELEAFTAEVLDGVHFIEESQ